MIFRDYALTRRLKRRSRCTRESAFFHPFADLIMAGPCTFANVPSRLNDARRTSASHSRGGGTGTGCFSPCAQNVSSLFRRMAIHSPENQSPVHGTRARRVLTLAGVHARAREDKCNVHGRWTWTIAQLESETWRPQPCVVLVSPPPLSLSLSLSLVLSVNVTLLHGRADAFRAEHCPRCVSDVNICIR